MYSLTVVASLTGVHLATLTKAVKSATWQTRLHSPGKATITLKIEPDRMILDWPEWRTMLEHWSRTYVISWNGVAVYAGLLEDWRWDEVASEVTVSLVELRNELEWRSITGVASYNPDASLTITNKSRRGMVRALYAAALNKGDANFYWNYSTLDLGPDFSGGFSKTYPHHKLSKVLELIEEWQNSDGGPDNHLDPEWRSGVLWWVLKQGDPRLSGATFSWSANAANSPLTTKLRSDGRAMTTGVFAIGEGEGSAMKVGKAGHGGDLVLYTPYRDRMIPKKLIADQSQLDSLAMGDLKPHFYPIRSKDLSLQITADDNPAVLRIGSRVKVWNAGKTLEPEGWFDGYLIGLSGDWGTSLKLEVQPWA